MKLVLSLLVLLLAVKLSGQDTLFVTSKSDYQKKLQLYQDSLTSYNIGHSVCRNLAKIFTGQFSDSDYNSYFLGAWDRPMKSGDIVDSSLASTEFLNITTFPNIGGGLQFKDMKLDIEYKRLDSCRVKPIGIVSGAEMPTIYIYAKPTQIIIYKAPCFSIQSKTAYQYHDIQTHFIVDDRGKTKIPYNIVYYYGSNGRLKKVEWVDPILGTVIRHFEINYLP